MQPTEWAFSVIEGLLKCKKEQFDSLWVQNTQPTKWAFNDIEGVLKWQHILRS